MLGNTIAMLIATAFAVKGIPQIPAAGKARTVLAARAGPPDTPTGLRVSATRHGASVKKLVGGGVAVGVGVAVGAEVGVAVGVGVNVMVGVGVIVGVLVGVLVAVGVTVEVLVRVAVGVLVTV